MVNKKQDKIKLSVVIPAYNEAERLPKTLLGLPKFLRQQKISSEIIVVDDGSSDETSHKVAKLDNSIKVIRHDTNHGKGEAVKTGVLESKCRHILMMDADNSIPIKELKKLWPHRNEYDVVIGSRFLGTHRFWTQNWSRLVVSKLGNVLFRLLFKLDIRDTQCGFKLFQARAAKRIFQELKTKGFGFDMELLVRANRLGYLIKEVPVVWRDSPGSSIRAVQAAAKTFWEIIQFYFRL